MKTIENEGHKNASDIKRRKGFPRECIPNYYIQYSNPFKGELEGK